MMEKWKRVLGKKARELADEALKIMKESADPLHNERHIKRILDDLLILKKEIAGIEDLIDWEVLILAIVWHDVWVSKNIYEGVAGMLWRYTWEGEGSARMFESRAKKMGLAGKKIKRIIEAIRNHPGLVWVRHKTLEARILWDLDNLETWSKERLEVARENLKKMGRNRKTRRQVKLAKIYFDNLMKKRKSDRLYFGWTRREFDKRKRVFLEKTGEINREYRNWMLVGNKGGN